MDQTSQLKAQIEDLKAQVEALQMSKTVRPNEDLVQEVSGLKALNLILKSRIDSQIVSEKSLRAELEAQKQAILDYEAQTVPEVTKAYVQKVRNELEDHRRYQNAHFDVSGLAITQMGKELKQLKESMKQSRQSSYQTSFVLEQQWVEINAKLAGELKELQNALSQKEQEIVEMKAENEQKLMEKDKKIEELMEVIRVHGQKTDGEDESDDDDSSFEKISIEKGDPSTPKLFDPMVHLSNDPVVQARHAALMSQRGGPPADSFKIVDNGVPTPTNFPPDARKGPGIPTGLKKKMELYHGEVVCATTISRDNTRVFTAGKGSVKIWDIQHTQMIDTLPICTLRCLNDDYIRSCKLFHDGSTLLIGGEASTVALWDLWTESKILELETGSQACYSLALSPDDKLLYACLADGNLLIYDIHNKEKICTLLAHQDGAACLDLSQDGSKLYTGGLDSAVLCWDLNQRKPIKKYDFDGQVFSLGCSPNDEWVAVGMENNNVEVVSTKVDEKYQLVQHESTVLSVKFAHSGKFFVSTGKDNAVNGWRTPYGASLFHLKENTAVLSCDISRDDSLIVTGCAEKKATLYAVEY